MMVLFEDEHQYSLVWKLMIKIWCFYDKLQTNVQNVCVDVKINDSINDFEV